MFRLLALLIGIAHAQTAPNYLVLASPAACLTRSQQMCASMHCDGVKTIYWWSCQTLTDGTAAIVVQPSGDFAAVNNRPIGACAVGCGLNAAEIAALQASGQLGTKLPWLLSVPAFKARFSPPQLSAIGASVDPVISVPWAALAAPVDLTSPTIIGMVNQMVTDGLITQAKAFNVLKSN